MAFDVPPTAKKMVLISAGKKWREFKSRLSTKYVLPHHDQPDMLQFPPADYTFIENDHWDMFVVDRLSKKFGVSFLTVFVFEFLRLQKYIVEQLCY